MKAEKHYSLKHADKVLGIIRRLIKQIPNDNYRDITVHAWSNGREQGYYLTCCHQHVCMGVVFAQQRNSDSVIVVWGECENFNISTNMPSDLIWQNNQKVIRDDVEAGQFIVEKLLDLQPTV